MRVWSSNPLAFNCGAALYSLQRATEAAKPFPMWESSKQPVIQLGKRGRAARPEKPGACKADEGVRNLLGKKVTWIRGEELQLDEHEEQRRIEPTDCE